MASIRISGGLPCKFVEMSRRSGRIDVLNPFGNPHWILVDGTRPPGGRFSTYGAAEPETSVWDQRCFTCSIRSIVTRIGIHVSGFRADDGSVQFSVLATSEMYRHLLENLNQGDYAYEILSAETLPRANSTRRLTQNQLQSLRVALREGFYEYPRKTNLIVLSKILGCSPSTLCETIRRGEKTILGRYVKEHDGENLVVPEGSARQGTRLSVDD